MFCSFIKQNYTDNFNLGNNLVPYLRKQSPSLMDKLDPINETTLPTWCSHISLGHAMSQMERWIQDWPKPVGLHTIQLLYRTNWLELPKNYIQKYESLHPKVWKFTSKSMKVYIQKYESLHPKVWKFVFKSFVQGHFNIKEWLNAKKLHLTACSYTRLISIRDAFGL